MPNSYAAQKDRFASVSRGISEPGGDIALIVPNDSTDLAIYCKALRIYVPANIAEATVKVTAIWATDDANTVTLKFMPGISYEPLSVRRVFATGTTAGIEIHGYTV